MSEGTFSYVADQLSAFLENVLVNSRLLMLMKHCNGRKYLRTPHDDKTKCTEARKKACANMNSLLSAKKKKKKNIVEQFTGCGPLEYMMQLLKKYKDKISYKPFLGHFCR